jgi:hypothetical protein
MNIQSLAEKVDTNFNYVLLIRFSADRGLFSRVMRLLTGVLYSHVDVILSKGDSAISCLDVQPSGVSLRMEDEIPDYPYEEYFYVELDDVKYQIYQEFCSSILFKPYDFFGALGIGLRTDKWQKNDRWYCAEAIGELLQRLDLAKITRAKRLSIDAIYAICEFLDNM